MQGPSKNARSPASFVFFTLSGSAAFFCLTHFTAAEPGTRPAADYRWLTPGSRAQSIRERIPPPRGFERFSESESSFAEWLRGLPLKPGRPQVMLHNGSPKKNQSAHHAVIDMDVGDKDLQQCADAIIRLRSEFLFARGRISDIRWSYTSGDMISFSSWAAGQRPYVQGRTIVWKSDPKNDRSYPSFRRYLENIYNYAGSLSLGRDLKKIPFSELRIGDVFLKGGSPGHAVIIVDLARNKRGPAFLLAQSYMPAQEMHVLENPAGNTPWYIKEEIGGELETPEWVFPRESLHRFAD